MSRNTTIDARNFKIYSLRQWGVLEPESVFFHKAVVWSRNDEETGRIGYCVSTVTGDSYIELDYKTRSSWGEEEWKPIKYRIPLESVRCHFGGKRWFFRCSLYLGGRYCGRRVAILYQVGDYFGCRHCADLTYESCNEGKRFRGFPWNMLFNDDKVQKAWEKVGYSHYRGRPTRKYRRYLKLAGQIDRIGALEGLQKMLGGGKI